MSKPAAPNLSALAKKMGVSRQSVHTWKNEGAPLHDEKKLRSWLAARKNIAKGVIKTSAALPAKAGKKLAASQGTAGAAEALKRLEQAELQAFERLQAAIGSGEDAVAQNELRKSWLSISESLRKFDLLVEANRREAGELVPREELEKTINSFLTAAWLASRMQVDSLVNQLVGKSEPWELGEILTRAADGRWLSAALGMMSGDKGIVGTVKKEIEGNFNLSPERMEARKKAIDGLLAEYARRVVVR